MAGGRWPVAIEDDGLADVGASGAGGFEARPAIAVLPFDNMGRDED